MAVKITIVKALEERARNGEDITKAVLVLVDRAKEKQAKPKGMAYKDLVAAFRKELGNDLIVPPNPSIGWIVRQCSRAADIGCHNQEYISDICNGVRRKYPGGSYQLDFLLRRGPEFAKTTDSGNTEHTSNAPVVYVGRDGDVLD